MEEKEKGKEGTDRRTAQANKIREDIDDCGELRKYSDYIQISTIRYNLAQYHTIKYNALHCTLLRLLHTA